MPTSYPILPDKSSVTALLGVDGDTLASFINPAVVIEGGFTQFARGSFHGLTVQATSETTAAGTGGTKVFGFSATTGHVNMGFKARRVKIRHNGAYNVHLGWVAGESTTGGVVTSVTNDAVSATNRVVVTTAAAHGLSTGDYVCVSAIDAHLNEDLILASGYYAITKIDATSFYRTGVEATDTTEHANSYGFWYKGFDSYVLPAVYTKGAVALGGVYCEASSIPNDWIELPYNIAALFVLNPSGSGGTITNTEFKAEVHFLR